MIPSPRVLKEVADFACEKFEADGVSLILYNKKNGDTLVTFTGVGEAADPLDAAIALISYLTKSDKRNLLGFSSLLTSLLGRMLDEDAKGEGDG